MVAGGEFEIGGVTGSIIAGGDFVTSFVVAGRDFDGEGGGDEEKELGEG